MTRWLAPAVGGAGFLALLLGLYRTSVQAGVSGGVAMVVWGAVGLLLAAIGAGIAEMVDHRRR